MPLSRPSAICNEDEMAAGILRVTQTSVEPAASAISHQSRGQGPDRGHIQLKVARASRRLCPFFIPLLYMVLNAGTHSYVNDP